MMRETSYLTVTPLVTLATRLRGFEPRLQGPQPRVLSKLYYRRNICIFRGYYFMIFAECYTQEYRWVFKTDGKMKRNYSSTIVSTFCSCLRGFNLSFMISNGMHITFAVAHTYPPILFP